MYRTDSGNCITRNCGGLGDRHSEAEFPFGDSARLVLSAQRNLILTRVYELNRRWIGNRLLPKGSDFKTKRATEAIASPLLIAYFDFETTSTRFRCSNHSQRSGSA